MYNAVTREVERELLPCLRLKILFTTLLMSESWDEGNLAFLSIATTRLLAVFCRASTKEMKTRRLVDSKTTRCTKTGEFQMFGSNLPVVVQHHIHL